MAPFPAISIFFWAEPDLEFSIVLLFPTGILAAWGAEGKCWSSTHGEIIFFERKMEECGLTKCFFSDLWCLYIESLTEIPFVNDVGLKFFFLNWSVRHWLFEKSWLDVLENVPHQDLSKVSSWCCLTCSSIPCISCKLEVSFRASIRLKWNILASMLQGDTMYFTCIMPGVT